MKSAFVALLALAVLASAAPTANRRVRRQCEPMPPSATQLPTEPMPTETMPTETMPTETSPVETTPVETPPVETPPVSGGGGQGGSVFSVYADVDVTADTWPTPADLGDWNDFLVAFYLTDGRNAFDIAAVWEGMDAAKKEQIISDYHAAGKKIRVSLFGATDMPLKHGGDPVAIGKQISQFVKDNMLDGVDVDYEDSESFNAAGDGENFLITLTKTLREELPAPYVISHAPQSPYFTTAGWYPQGAYNKVHAEVGSMIDFYNMQWYNQGDGMYESCDGLFKGDATSIPGTSFDEIVAQGVPANKINIGKPGGPGDASNGYMTPQMLGECISNASQKPGGVMSWEWHTAKADWIAAAKGDL